MNELIFVRTIGVNFTNFSEVLRILRDWLPGSYQVYREVDPGYISRFENRILIRRETDYLVLKEGDIFSLVQKSDRSHDVVVHNRPHTCGQLLRFGSDEYVLEPYVCVKIGDTRNMKFRLTCLTDTNKSETFDDVQSLNDRLNSFVDQVISELLLHPAEDLGETLIGDE